MQPAPISLNLQQNARAQRSGGRKTTHKTAPGGIMFHSISMRSIAAAAAAGGMILALANAGAQTREQGPWWPSPHGPDDQAGASNYVTPEKILAALSLPRTGQAYELGHIYEQGMPLYGERPWYLATIPGQTPTSEEGGAVHSEYFTGYIGQMGTQWDALGHQGENVRMADGSFKTVFYNGFTEEELTGRNRGLGGLEALGAEHVKPFITRGILLDIAAYKGVDTLPAAYEITLADVRGALARQGMSESTIEPGDAVLLNYGWSGNWGNPSKYNDSYVGRGENEGSPGIGGEVAHWLVERKIAVVGADSCCVEVRPRPDADVIVHHILFRSEGISMIENMVFDELARDEVYEFLFLALTERIKGATGSPVRPIAVR
jgi:kynurenine formamidase